MTIQGTDEFVSGYSLGGDARQLNSIVNNTPAQQEAAVMTVCRRYRAEEAWEVLGMLGLTEVATRLREAVSGGEAA